MRSGIAGFGKMWRLQPQELLFYEFYGRGLGGIVLSPDGQRLAILGADSVELRGAGDAYPFPPLLGHASAPTAATFSPDSGHLVVSDAGGFVKVYDLTRRGGAYSFGEHQYRIDTVDVVARFEVDELCVDGAELRGDFGLGIVQAGHLENDALPELGLVTLLRGS